VLEIEKLGLVFGLKISEDITKLFEILEISEK